MTYCIIETEDGWSVAECPGTETAQEVAERFAAVVIDPGPYRSYDDANEALVALQEELGDDDASDVPATRTLEGRGKDEE